MTEECTIEQKAIINFMMLTTLDIHILGGLWNIKKFDFQNKQYLLLWEMQELNKKKQEVRI